MSDRTAKIILSVVGLGAAWGIVAAAPWLAYVVVGVLLDRGWQKARSWRESRHTEEPFVVEAMEAEVLDVITALQHLARGGRHVLLTELRDELGVADTKIVRALLDEVGIPIRSGVRTPARNGPGVHHDDVPFDSPGDGADGGCCSCRSTANANANNSGRGDGEKGLRVEPIGLAGAVIRDPADATRHHRLGG